MAKHFVANALDRIIDRAIQVHGALGYSTDTPLAQHGDAGALGALRRRRRRGAPVAHRAAHDRRLHEDRQRHERGGRPAALGVEIQRRPHPTAAHLVASRGVTRPGRPRRGCRSRRRCPTARRPARPGASTLLQTPACARRDREPRVRLVVAPAVRQADDAGHHLVAHLDRRHELPAVGAHARAAAVGDARARGVGGMHEQRAAVAPVTSDGHVVHPRVVRAQVAAAHEHEPVVAALEPRARAAGRRP